MPRDFNEYTFCTLHYIVILEPHAYAFRVKECASIALPWHFGVVRRPVQFDVYFCRHLGRTH